MVRVYVAHCPVYCPDRRPIIEQNLKSRGFTDIVWVTSYPVSHPIVPWLHKRLGGHLTLGGISCLIKHLEAMRMFILDTKSPDGAIFCDDDTLFIRNWRDALLHIRPNWPYVNLSVGVNFHYLPDAKPRVIQLNNGGNEAHWKSKEFCKFVLANVDARAGMDHVHMGMMNHLRVPCICVPVAQQTSLLCGKASTSHDHEFTIYEPWYIFVQQLKPTGISYEDLWNESGIAREDA